MADTTSPARRLKECTVFGLILLILGLFLAHKQDMSIADIGRHIRNGEIFLKFSDAEVLWTNYYSYTEPKFPVLNHHWGSGALFYLVWRVAGFQGVHVFYVSLYLITFGIFFWIAKRQNGLVAAGIPALLMIPLLVLRTEIRPELFSYLFSGIFFCLLTIWQERRGPLTHLFVLLPFMEMLWVNLHIYFILGPAIVGVFWLDSIIRDRKNARNMLVLLALTSIATLFNPFGFQGAVAPFTIFRNYGISIAENHSVWYIDKFFGAFSYDTLYFKVVCVLLVLSYLWVFVKRPRELHLPNLLLAIFLSAIACLAIRNMALFGLFSVPIMANNISIASCRKVEDQSVSFLASVFLIVIVTAFLYSNGKLNHIFHLSPETGFGMAAGNASAAEFIKKNRLRGPIFNNYDAGGYLIYHLFPDEKVFVDNRPEAYSEDFFKQVYLPMQFLEWKWQQIQYKLKFNTIVLARRSDEIGFFVNARMNDPEWRLVFDDPFFLIFTRR